MHAVHPRLHLPRCVSTCISLPSLLSLPSSVQSSACPCASEWQRSLADAAKKFSACGERSGDEREKNEWTGKGGKERRRHRQSQQCDDASAEHPVKESRQEWQSQSPRSLDFTRLL